MHLISFFEENNREEKWLHSIIALIQRAYKCKLPFLLRKWKKKWHFVYNQWSETGIAGYEAMIMEHISNDKKMKCAWPRTCRCQAK
jgi:hypothetical protein